MEASDFGILCVAADRGALVHMLGARLKTTAVSFAWGELVRFKRTETWAACGNGAIARRACRYVREPWPAEVLASDHCENSRVNCSGVRLEEAQASRMAPT